MNGGYPSVEQLELEMPEKYFLLSSGQILIHSACNSVRPRRLICHAKGNHARPQAFIFSRQAHLQEWEVGSTIGRFQGDISFRCWNVLHGVFGGVLMSITSLYACEERLRAEQPYRGSWHMVRLQFDLVLSAIFVNNRPANRTFTGHSVHSRQIFHLDFASAVGDKIFSMQSDAT